MRAINEHGIGDLSSFTNLDSSSSSRAFGIVILEKKREESFIRFHQRASDLGIFAISWDHGLLGNSKFISEVFLLFFLVSCNKRPAE